MILLNVFLYLFVERIWSHLNFLTELDYKFYMENLGFEHKLKIGVGLVLSNWPAIKLVINECESSIKKNQ